MSQCSIATLFYFDNICPRPIGSPKRKFTQLGSQAYFSFSNMPQTVKDITHSIEMGG